MRKGHSRMLRSKVVTAVLAAGALALAGMLGGCGEFSPPYMKPLSPQTQALLAQKGMTEDSPILIRIFKAESELEVWKAKDDGRFHLFKTYPICSYSGGLGPKVSQGDRQAPEGFYLVSEDQMNPRSKYHLSFNVGFPNAYDRALDRTGQDIMVHGDCTSAGCYAMTDGVIEEIFTLAREALEGGQQAFQLQAYPFRMTAANMAAHQKDQWYDFWKNLKEGYDYFEITHLPPRVAVCDKHYLINAAFVDRGAHPDPAGPCPAFERLPVSRAPAEQVASTKKPNETPLTKPLALVMGLTLGPQKPVYRAFTLGPATPTEPKASAEGK
jgi:murein L,D-transpeptidase YafK